MSKKRALTPYNRHLVRGLVMVQKGREMDRQQRRKENFMKVGRVQGL